MTLFKLLYNNCNVIITCLNIFQNCKVNTNYRNYLHYQLVKNLEVTFYCYSILGTSSIRYIILLFESKKFPRVYLSYEFSLVNLNSRVHIPMDRIIRLFIGKAV